MAEEEQEVPVEKTPEQIYEETYASFVVKPHQVTDLWEAESPNCAMSTILIDFIKALKEMKQEQEGVDITYFNEFENRYERKEFSWMADYFVHNLVFAKNKLQLEETETIAKFLHAFWETLDFLNFDPYQQSFQTRYKTLTGHLQELFKGKELKKEQIKLTLEYAKTSIFGHLHLYIECLSRKQT